MSILLTSLPAPLNWLSLGLLAGPAGLLLIGLGVMALAHAPADADKL